ncbi:MAG: group III truncated hemoglobin [Daejeonella sp.]
MGKADIKGLDDIKVFVDDFYGRIQHDALLAPIFNFRLSTHWGPHLEKMYLFWNAALFGIKGYSGSPFMKHATMDLNSEHFERWLNLFNRTIDEHFEGPVASDAKRRALLMAEMFRSKLDINSNTSRHVF